MKRRFPLHVHISTLFLTLILIVGGVIGGLGYKISHNILETTASDLSTRISRETLSEFTNIIGPAEMATRLLSFDGITQAKSLDERLANLGFMREALNNSEALTSIYVGYGNGDFFMVRRIRSESGRKFFNAPEGTAFIVQSIDHAGDTPRGHFIYLDARLATLRSDDRPDYATAFDPRTRDWYKAALAAGGQIKTPPYLFFTTQRVGTTIANRASKVGSRGRRRHPSGNPRPVAGPAEGNARHRGGAGQPGGADARLRGRREIHHACPRRPMASRSWPISANSASPSSPSCCRLLQSMDGTAARDLVADGRRRRIGMRRIRPVKLEGTRPLFLITAIPDRELMAAAHALMRHSLIVMALVILLAIPITWWLARGISGPLRQLAHEAEAIRRFEFSQPIKVDSHGARSQ